MDRMMLMISVAVILLLSSSPLGHSDVCVCPRVDPGLCPKTQLLLCESSPLDRYTIVKGLGQGFFGETWLVSQLGNVMDEFVLKRIKTQVQGHTSFYYSGLRERYFGPLFLTSGEHVGRFVESFDVKNDIYLVSFFEGISLEDLIYDVKGSGLKRSNWWVWLRRTDGGRKIMQELIFQLLKAVDFCHKKNITHRDLKPSNILICFRRDVGSCSEARRLTGDGVTGIHVRLIDFGSAVDAFSMQNLYPDGPSSAEQTFSYMPPEALFGNAWLQGPAAARAKYDMWTIGQTIAELILGTPSVFTVYTVESMKLATKLLVGGDTVGDSKLIVHRIITLSEFCITIPGIQQYSSSQCSNQSFWEYVKRRDPLKLGFLDSSLMHLVRHLLAGDPDQRLTAQEALNHPYFLGSFRDLEVEQLVENDSKTPQRSLRRQCLFFHWMCHDVEEKRRSS